MLKFAVFYQLIDNMELINIFKITNAKPIVHLLSLFTSLKFTGLFWATKLIRIIFFLVFMSTGIKSKNAHIFVLFHIEYNEILAPGHVVLLEVDISQVHLEELALRCFFLTVYHLWFRFHLLFIYLTMCFIHVFILPNLIYVERIKRWVENFFGRLNGQEPVVIELEVADVSVRYKLLRFVEFQIPLLIHFD